MASWMIIDGLKVANCISRAPARSIIRHKDKIHFDVLFYSPSRHQNRNGRCIIIYFARLDPKAWWPWITHTKKQPNTSVQEPRQRSERSSNESH
jgi:hypothetical protein